MVSFSQEELDAATEAGEKIPVAVAARYRRSDRKLEIIFAHGVEVAVPVVFIQDFYLMAKWPTPSQLSKIEIWGAGSSLYFPLLDEFIWAIGLLNGVYGSDIWMEGVTRATASLRARASAKLVRRKGRQARRPWRKLVASAPLTLGEYERARC
jgi:hypothetical protein